MAEKDYDALWSAAALLSIISISSIDATNAEEAWPLKPPDKTDLDWLRLAEGKMSVWELTNPLRPNSIVSELREEMEHNKLLVPVKTATIEEIPKAFLQLYNITPELTPDNNPYLVTVRKLSLLLPLVCDQSLMLQFLSFIGHFQPRFRQLLDQKDPKALLLMVYWYAKVCTSPHWWLVRRATLEGQAICIFLGRYHG